MLSLPDRALLVKLFYVNGESASVALRKFRTAKRLKKKNGPISGPGVLKLVKRFEETGSLKDRPRSGRPSLAEGRITAVETVMNDMAAESSTRSSSSRKASKVLDVPHSSIRRILHGVLHLYPYKLQSLQEIQPGDTAMRESFAKWALERIENTPQWLFNVFWTDEAHFSLQGDVNTQNTRIWATSNPREYTTQPLHSLKLTVWCGFTSSFIVGPFFFEESCPKSGWKTCTVTGERYLTLLRDKVVPALNQRNVLSVISFMQDGAPPHYANPVKRFLLKTFGEDRIISRGCKIAWPPRSPDLNPADFWLWGYLKSLVYRSSPSTLAELKDCICREVSAIHSDMLHSAVTGVVSRLSNVVECAGGHVEQLLLHK